jgi:hypothetical protein
MDSVASITTFNMINNVQIGMASYANQFGTGNNQGAMYVEDNTVVGCGNGAFKWGSGTPAGTFESNAVLEGQAQVKCVWAAATAGNGYWANYNDWFMCSTQTTSPATGSGESSLDSWTQYLAYVYPQDANSYDTDPLFVNAPPNYAPAGGWGDTPTTLSIGAYYIQNFAVGDNVEIGWDGVLRQITAVNTSTDVITFTPAKNNNATQLFGGVANFKTGTNPIYNLAFKPGSPCIGTNGSGGNIGSSINIANWQNCDFNGDGRRDIPAYPPTMPLPPG